MIKIPASWITEIREYAITGTVSCSLVSLQSRLAHRVGPYRDISKSDNEIIRRSISVFPERSRLGFSIFLVTIDM